MAAPGCGECSSGWTFMAILQSTGSPSPLNTPLARSLALSPWFSSLIPPSTSLQRPFLSLSHSSPSLPPLHSSPPPAIFSLPNLRLSFPISPTCPPLAIGSVPPFFPLFLSSLPCFSLPSLEQPPTNYLSSPPHSFTGWIATLSTCTRPWECQSLQPRTRSKRHTGTPHPPHSTPTQQQLQLQLQNNYSYNKCHLLPSRHHWPFFFWFTGLAHPLQSSLSSLFFLGPRMGR